MEDNRYQKEVSNHNKILFLPVCWRFFSKMSNEENMRNLPVLLEDNGNAVDIDPDLNFSEMYVSKVLDSLAYVNKNWGFRNG